MELRKTRVKIPDLMGSNVWVYVLATPKSLEVLEVYLAEDNDCYWLLLAFHIFVNGLLTVDFQPKYPFYGVDVNEPNITERNFIVPAFKLFIKTQNINWRIEIWSPGFLSSGNIKGRLFVCLLWLIDTESRHDSFSRENVTLFVRHITV